MNERDVARFTAHYRVVGECWEWQGAANPYGRIRVDGRQREAYRISYEHFIGPVPLGLELDHLCRNTRCVRPNHLEAVTHAENSLRGHAPHVLVHHAGRCIRGHAVIGENAAPHGRGNHPICRQ